MQEYQTFTEFNNTGLDGLFLYPAEVVPAFIPLVLFACFSIALLATYFSQKGLTGRGDFVSSFAVAGYFIAIISIVMTLTPNLINVGTLVICVSISILGTILLLISRDR